MSQIVKKYYYSFKKEYIKYILQIFSLILIIFENFEYFLNFEVFQKLWALFLIFFFENITIENIAQIWILKNDKLNPFLETFWNPGNI